MSHDKWAKLAIIATITLALSITAASFAALTANQTVPYSGSISAVNLGVYTDIGCTVSCTSLSAGTVSPGGTVTQTVYIKNTGNVPETLTMATSNWVGTPANSTSVMTFAWDKQNTVLNAGSSTPAILTLTVASNVGTLTSFSFSVTFTGTQ
jgi:archaellum component FlaG (FlaF/FlaG flagellin family)